LRGTLAGELSPNYEAFLEGGGGEAGLKRDNLFAEDGLGDPDVAGVDDEVLVGAVVVGPPGGVTERYESPCRRACRLRKTLGMRLASESAVWPTMYVFEPRL